MRWQRQRNTETQREFYGVVTIGKLLPPRIQDHPHLPSTQGAPGQGEQTPPLPQRSRCGLKNRCVAKPPGFFPPASPWPCFWRMIALLLFSVSSNSSIFYHLDPFIDTSSLYKEFVYRMIRHPPAHIPRQLERLKCSAAAIHIPRLLLWRVFCDFSFWEGCVGGDVFTKPTTILISSCKTRCRFERRQMAVK